MSKKRKAAVLESTCIHLSSDEPIDLSSDEPSSPCIDLSSDLSKKE